MKDTVIKETGNSRFLRSSVAEDITFAELIALLRAGQLPIDLAGINEEGIDTLGMPLRKSTLLDDETETAIWGSPGDRKPTEALKTIFETLSAGVSKKAMIVTGTYTGNMKASRIISLGFTPVAVILASVDGVSWGPGFCISGHPYQNGASNTSDRKDVLDIVDGGFEVHSHTTTGIYGSDTNKNNTVYIYVAIA